MKQNEKVEGMCIPIVANVMEGLHFKFKLK